jgi:hypothetical protein
LIAVGAKKIETRSWATSYRGLVAIHQAAGFPREFNKAQLIDVCLSEPFHSALIAADMLRIGKRHNIPGVWRDHPGYFYLECKVGDPRGYSLVLPRGRIVAVATLTNCHRIPDVPRHFPRGVPDDHPHASYPVVLPPFSDTPERAFGDYWPGRYAWLLADVRRLPEPIPHRGALSLWAVPAELEQRIAEQLG